MFLTISICTGSLIMQVDTRILCTFGINTCSSRVLQHDAYIIAFGATLKVGGGGHNASDASSRAGIVREEGDVTPTDNFLRLALPALVLGALLAVCCYFGILGNALLCESYYSSTTNYTN